MPRVFTPLPEPFRRLHHDLARQVTLDPRGEPQHAGNAAVAVACRRIGGRDVVFVTLLHPEYQLLADADLARIVGLSPRETDVARRLARRHTDAEIAQELNLKVSTVRRYTEAVLARLQVRSRRDVATALRARTAAGVWYEGS